MAGLIGRQKKGFKVSPVSLRASSGSILSSAAAAAAPGETDERRPRLIRPARLGSRALLVERLCYRWFSKATPLCIPVSSRKVTDLICRW